MQRNPPKGGGEPAKREQIERIVHSDTFREREPLKRLLTYLADRTLAGAAGSLKEYTVGRGSVPQAGRLRSAAGRLGPPAHRETAPKAGGVLPVRRCDGPDTCRVAQTAVPARFPGFKARPQNRKAIHCLGGANRAGASKPQCLSAVETCQGKHPARKQRSPPQARVESTSAACRSAQRID